MWLTIVTITLVVLVLINAFMVVALWGLAIKTMKLTVDKHVITVEVNANEARKELSLLQERADRLVATMMKINDIAGNKQSTHTNTQRTGLYDCQAG